MKDAVRNKGPGLLAQACPAYRIGAEDVNRTVVVAGEQQRCPAHEANIVPQHDWCGNRRGSAFATNADLEAVGAPAPTYDENYVCSIALQNPPLKGLRPVILRLRHWLAGGNGMKSYVTLHRSRSADCGRFHYGGIG